MAEYTTFEHYPMEFASRDYDCECGFCYADNGYGVLMMIQGDSFHVPITKEQAAFLRGRIFGHNHPGNAPLGTGDVDWACEAGLGELRVTTIPYLYSLRPRPGMMWTTDTWKYIIRPCLDFYGREVGLFDDEYNMDYIDGFYVDENANATEYSNDFYQNEPWDPDDIAQWIEVWSLVAKSCNLEFRVMKWSERNLYIQ
jgi:hypothetical protein